MSEQPDREDSLRELADAVLEQEAGLAAGRYVEIGGYLFPGEMIAGELYHWWREAAAQPAVTSADSAAAPLWDCAAYGPEGRALGALCFISGALNARRCASRDECARVMRGEQQRVFRRINELAANGDVDMAYLAGEFTHPGQLLMGDLGDE